MTDEILVGKLIADRYRIVRRLGGGGMGVVYVAIQEPLGREVALKVVKRELSGERRTLERFRREAESLAKVHHPHIITLHEFGELPSGALWFAMELVRGEDLRQRIVRDGPVSVKKSVAIIRDATAGLAAAHALGIIHRDLKPENILLMEAAGRPDFVKLVDFGVAKLPVDVDADPNDPASQRQLTMKGTVVGTPGYIAPEVALKDVTTDPRSDLYSLGVVWFECLTGRAPYSARTATALMMMHAVEPIPALPAEVPLPIAGLVQRLLAKNPDDRPANAEVLLSALDALPNFSSDAAVPRPGGTQPFAYVEPSAATVDDSGSAQRAPGGAPLPGSFSGSFSDSVANAPTETTVKEFPSRQTIERATAVTEGVGVPGPPPARSRVPLFAGVAGVALGAVAVAVAVAAWMAARSTMTTTTTTTTIVDAGTTVTPIANVVHDAGVAAAVTVMDAGTVEIKKPKPKPKPKKDAGTGEYKPDIYDDDDR